jgi:RNA polymerase sigma factor (sigma-70 family)
VRRLATDIQSGRLYYGEVDANVLRDIVVAQGLELRDERAAVVFNTDYMPAAIRHAEQVAGRQVTEVIENLAADLILPRNNRPPRIATYRGRTPLAGWLRSVVLNACMSSLRKPQRVEIVPEPADPGSEDALRSLQGKECEDRLAPAFVTAVREIATEERVLLKLLVLDGVQQKQVATGLGIDPGTLTRRKQRAASHLLAQIRELGHSGVGANAVRDCLELLAGDSPRLRLRMATILAGELIRGLPEQESV